MYTITQHLSTHPLDEAVLATLLRLLSFFFVLAASEFAKGKLLVRLSAPVVLLILPFSLPNIVTHTPMQNSSVLNANPEEKAKEPR